ncbi:aminopeptidase P family protein [Chondrinema litorale]|uniref:aminopeptidase P family protein n=1 Tax=Chondrinema litorale TaxID=2994555 RepID=UPI00254376D9|nr:aminopeptidase P family protein [Chondrinema litorale]UZR92658.1 aminopeptidase P family protein [Chondrinema litorale]
MKYAPLQSKLFVKNRKNLSKLLNPESLVVFHSNDITPTSADGVRPFIQQTDLFYLSGIDQEETILLLFPDCLEEKHREILFIKETSELIAIWEGHKHTKDEAQEISGIKSVYWLSEFDNIFPMLAFEAQNIYLNTNEHARTIPEVESRDNRFLKQCKERFPLHNYKRVAPLMQYLRAIKSEYEVDAIQTACDITEKAFRRVLGFVKPGVWEFEVEAEIIHEFIRNRSRRPAYDSIIASGASSCILHYITNDKQCQDGDLLLMDFGCEYANYAADLTRTIPVNGKFSQRQKDVYNAVLRVQKKAIEMLVPGNYLKDYQKEISLVIEKELIDLDLLDAQKVKDQNPDQPLYRKYFMHGVSHHLGLDVHDYGSTKRKFEAGMVLTCEPGIYIREENIGIRIENNILITKDGNVDLMKNIPREVEEIEEIMNA